jgi:hypothetical protein
MSEPISLSTLGPHSPEYTVQVANAMAECVRVLNHATRLGEAIGYPSTVYDVLGALYTATARFPQLLDQLSGWLEHMTEAGSLGEDQHGDVIGVVAAAEEALARTSGLFGSITSALQAAQQAISGLHLASQDEEQPQ